MPEWFVSHSGAAVACCLQRLQCKAGLCTYAEPAELCCSSMRLLSCSFVEGHFASKLFRFDAQEDINGSLSGSATNPVIAKTRHELTAGREQMVAAWLQASR